MHSEHLLQDGSLAIDRVIVLQQPGVVICVHLIVSLLYAYSRKDFNPKCIPCELLSVLQETSSVFDMLYQVHIICFRYSAF